VRIYGGIRLKLKEVVPMNRQKLQQVLEELSGLKYDFVVDAHCHIESDLFTQEERERILDIAIKKYRVRMFTTPITMQERVLALKLSEKYSSSLFIVTGSHPLSEEPLDDVIEFIRKHKKIIVGIGEVGLDFTPPNNTSEIKERQIRKFETFIQLAKEMNKPLVVHSRSAGKYALDILIKNGAEKVLMHAFSGKAKYAKKGIEAGFYFSIPPNAAFSPQKRSLINVLPIENILLETDSPYMRLFNNVITYPWHVLISATIIAVAKEMEVEEVIRVTTQNAQRLFSVYF